MKKRGKKVVSLLLAATLTCSTVVGAATAFAAENADVTYEASYSMTAPKSTYTGMMQDADKLIADAAFTGDTIETLWGIAPALGGTLSNLARIDFYTEGDSELFANLPEYMEAQGATEVTADLLTGYFEAYPCTVESATDFLTRADAFVDTVLAQRGDLYNLLILAISLLAGAEERGTPLYQALDDVVTALGIEQPHSLVDICVTGGMPEDAFNGYIKNIVHALIPDTAEGLMNVLRNVADPANNAKLYAGLSTALDLLPTYITNIQNNPLVGMFAPGLDLSGVIGPIEQVRDIVASLPATTVVVDGEAVTAFDINGILDYVVNDVLVPMVAQQLGADVVATIEQVLVDLGLEDLKLVSFDGSKAVLKFDAVNTANLANAADAEDALNVILHYLYTNMNKTQNKLVLSAVNGIASLVNVLPAEVSTILNAVLKQSEPDAVATIAAMLAKLANRNPVTAVTIEQGENVVLSAGKNGNMYTGSVQLTAVVTPDNATNKDITWSSNLENVTVDANGLVSYKGTLDVPFDATITATAVGGASDTITVHIEKASVTGVSLDTVYAELNEGATLKLNAKVAPANAENKEVTWSTDNEAVATVAADGTVTAVAPGTAKITVTTVDGGLTAICVVEVRADKTALNALLDKVAGMELVEENYDADKWAAYEAAFDAAEATAAEELATQAEVNAAVAALNAALKALPAGVDLTEVKIVSTSDTLEGNVIYHKVPWYKTWMSQTVDLALEYTEGAEIVSVQWQAANWSIDDPEAEIENADNDSATIRPTFGIGARSFWVQAVVTDVNGNVVTSDPVKVRFYNWDWQK